MHNQNLVFTFKCTSCGEENHFELNNKRVEEQEEQELIFSIFFENFSLKKLKQIRLITIIMSIVIAIAIITFVFSYETALSFFRNFMNLAYAFYLYLFINFILILFFSVSAAISMEAHISIKKRKLQ